MSPIEETRVLPSGRVVHLRMPEMYKLLASTRGIPNPGLAAVLKLLAGEGNLEAMSELERLKTQQSQIRGLYELAALCVERPRLRLDLKDGEAPGEGETTPDEWPLGDLEAVYGFFRYGPRSGLGAAANGADDAAHARPAGAALPDAPEPVPGG